LRRYFLYDRKLLADLSRSAWESLKVFLQEVVPENDPIPGAVIAIQTFGDFLGFNPHCHILVTDGCFYGKKGMFRVAPPLELKKLEAIFRHKVLRMLLNRGKITAEMSAMLSKWRHSGFHVFCGNRISPNDETALENLARYIIRTSFSQERMQYLDQEEKVSDHFLEKFNILMKKEVKGLTPEAIHKLLLQDWPGNVRELENTIEYAMAMARSDEIVADDLLRSKPTSAEEPLKPLKDAKNAFERSYLISLLQACRGNVSEAAQLAGKYRADFYVLLTKHNLDPADFRIPE
jgi:hypothetical protein